MTQEAKSGDTVRVHYTGTLADGSEFDSSRDRDPLEVTLGSGEVIPGFETALVGMSPGDRQTITVAAAEAYGERLAARVFEVERTRIPPEVDLEVGGAVYAEDSAGQQLRLVVRALEEETVVLDANHPLAGQDLTFDLELVEIV
jgi:peptidylprolyl isomerase